MSEFQLHALNVWLGFGVGVISGLFVERYLRSGRRTRLRLASALVVVPLLVVALPWLFDSAKGALVDEDAGELSVLLEVRSSGGTWTQATAAHPGDLVEFQLSLRNLGPGDVERVLARVNDAPNLEFVPFSVKLLNSGSPPGGRGLGEAGASLFTTGVSIGTYSDGAAAYLYWQAQVPDDLVDDHEFRVVGVGRDTGNDGNEIFNTAILTVEP